MRLETRQFNDHIWYIDNGLLDAAGVGTTYVVRGDQIAIVETGTSRCASNVLDGLQRLQIDPSDVRHIVLTHIHMDHAGGTGTLLKAMPEAQVYIHSRTAEFLTDPSRLVASAERALGDLFTLHGTVEMVDQERVVHADDLRLDLGRGVVLRAVATPGHSPDHLAYYDESSRCLFTGDAIGINVPAGDYIGPVTPPPALNLEAQRATFTLLQQMQIDTLLFSHYGPSSVSPQQVIPQLQERFEELAHLVRNQWEAGHVDHDAIIRTTLERTGSSQAIDGHTRWLMAGWVEMSIKGLVVFFERQAKQARQG